MKLKTDKDNYEAVVIGAGPAGASLAYFLSLHNISTALIEKKHYPDRPVRCAEIVPSFITSLFDEKIGGINRKIDFMDTYINGHLASSVKSSAIMLDRELFTDFLIKRFIEKGGSFFNGCRAVSIKNYGPDFTGKKASCQSFCSETKCLRLKDSSSFRLKSKIIVFAGGPPGSGNIEDIFKIKKNEEKENKYITGNSADNDLLIGINANFESIKRYENRSMIFFYPFIKNGYGWLFPKDKSFNTGLAVKKSYLKHKDIKNIFAQFQNHLVEKRFITGLERKNSFTCGIIFAGGLKTHMMDNNILAAGDALGLVNPVTGAGIYNAVLASKIISERTAGFIKKSDAGSAFSKESPDAVADYNPGAFIKRVKKDIEEQFSISISRAYSKRRFMEENWDSYDFNELIKKCWVSFKDYFKRD